MQKSHNYLDPFFHDMRNNAVLHEHSTALHPSVKCDHKDWSLGQKTGTVSLDVFFLDYNIVPELGVIRKFGLNAPASDLLSIF